MKAYKKDKELNFNESADAIKALEKDGWSMKAPVKKKAKKAAK
jgi:predicted RNA binding protein YcfA (HicA-like mRNA interferase family)